MPRVEPSKCPFCGAEPDNSVDIRQDRWSHTCPKTQGLRVWWTATHWATRQEMAIAHLRKDHLERTDLAKVIPLRGGRLA